MKTIPDSKNKSPGHILHEWVFEFIRAVETDTKKNPPNAARSYFIFGNLVWNAYAVVDPRFPFVDGFSTRRSKMPTTANEKDKWKLFYSLFYILWEELRKNFLPSMKSFTDPFPRFQFLVEISFRKNVIAYLTKRKNDGHDNSSPFNFPNSGKWIDSNSGIKQNLSSYLTNTNSWTPIQTTINGQIKKQNPLAPYFGSVWNWFTSADWTEIDRIGAEFYPSATIFNEQVDKLVEINSSLTDEEKMKAEVWAGFEADRATPPGKAMILLSLLIAAKSYNVKESAALIGAVSSSLFHAAVAAWKIKYDYLQPRPIQNIRLNYDSQNIVSPYDGTSKDGAFWLPYQPEVHYTPPFPDYISGHSTFTMAFSTVMNLALNIDEIPIQGCMIDPIYFKLFSAVFDNMTEPTLFSTLALRPESSLVISDTPAVPIELKWQTWSQLARESGMSRIYGGIHWENSNMGGLAVGQWIGSNILSKLKWSSLGLQF